MMRACSVVLVLLLVSLVQAAERLPVGTSRGPVEVVVPDDYDDAKRYPLIVALHGYGGTGAGLERYFGFSSLVDEKQFLVVYPDGTRDGGNRNFWNGTNACCDFGRTGVDDVGFLAGLVATISDAFSVDPKRVYFSGHSNGGFMSFRMACERPDLVAAIADLAGAAFLNPDDCVPNEPVNILHVHGTSDTVIYYTGGPQNNSGQYPSAAETVGQWARFNSCPSTTMETVGMLDLEANLVGDDTTVRRFEGCAPNGAVELWAIENGSHGPSFNVNFAEEMVDWLLAHPKQARTLDGPVYLAPHLASSWMNLLLVDNLGATEGLFDLVIFDDAGAEVGRFEYGIAAGGFQRIDITELAPTAATARVETKGADLHLRLAYREPSQGGLAEFSLSTETHPRLYFNFGVYGEDVIPLTFKALAIGNPGDQAAQVTLQAMDVNGSILATAEVGLEPRTRYRAVLDDLFTVGDGFDFTQVARVEAIGDQPLNGLVISGVGLGQLLFGPAVGRLSSVDEEN